MKFVAIIHPFSSAHYLTEELRKQGVATLGVLTLPQDSVMEYMRPDPSWFDEFLYLPNATPEALRDALKQYNLAWIISGAEASTHLTDTIMNFLMPAYANDPATSALRSNKYLAQEALARQGFPVIRQEKVNPEKLSVDELQALHFPVYCKPVHGLATVGGFRAENPQELVETMRSHAREIDFFDTSEYLIQEFVEAEEFIVDSFSYQGKHAVSSVHHCVKELVHNTPVYRYIEIIRDKDLWERYANYVKQCLDLTGLKNGFAHTEGFHCADNELKLIEINPRISGIKGYCNKAAKAVNLKTQIDLLVAALDSKLQESRWEDMNKSARIVTLFNFKQKPLRNPEKTLRNFKTLIDYSLLTPVGQIGKKGAKNLADLDMMVLLASEDDMLLEEETQRLFALEQSGELL